MGFIGLTSCICVALGATAMYVITEVVRSRARRSGYAEARGEQEPLMRETDDAGEHLASMMADDEQATLDRMAAPAEIRRWREAWDCPENAAYQPASGDAGADLTGWCWCCGDECMFCDGEGCAPVCWCPECKYGTCDDCCGCDECREHKRAGWTPPGMVRTGHGRDIPGPLARAMRDLAELRQSYAAARPRPATDEPPQQKGDTLVLPGVTPGPWKDRWNR